MKQQKKSIFCILLIMAVFCSSVFTGSIPVNAEQKKPVYTIPFETEQEKIHIRTGVFSGTFVSVELPKRGYRVENLVSNSKYCKAKVAKRGVTYKRETDNEYEVISESIDSIYNWLGLYVSKNGTYDIRFDIVDDSGQLVKSKSLTVYANKDEAIKSVTVDGKKLKSYERTFCIDKKDATLQIKMASGYKLTEIKMQSYRLKPKTIQNGKKFRLQNARETYYITIYYKDKYTKRIENKTFSVKNWKI